MPLIRPCSTLFRPQPESPNQKSFLDLPPEIRLRVYQYLFEGQKVFIRSEDDPIEQKRLEYKLRVRRMEQGGQSLRHELYLTQPCPCYEEYARYRAMGLNILFASKTCLAEARSVLVSEVTFHVDVDAYLGAPSLQILYWVDEAHIRFLNYRGRGHGPCQLCTYPSETVTQAKEGVYYYLGIGTDEIE